MAQDLKFKPAARAGGARLELLDAIERRFVRHGGGDGVTMELVQKYVHARAVSGAAHTGGASIVRSQREF